LEINELHKFIRNYPERKRDRRALERAENILKINDLQLIKSLVLTPSFSSSRGRIIGRFAEQPTAALAGYSHENQALCDDCSFSWGRRSG